MVYQSKVTTEFQSYKDFKDRESMNWGDAIFRAIERLSYFRILDFQQFQSAVAALDIMLVGFQDPDYWQQLKEIEDRRTILMATISAKDANFIYYDDKAKVLVRLAHRATKGQTRVRESAENSIFLRAIAKQIVDGKGVNIAITGMPGSGKSWSMLYVARKVEEYINEILNDPKSRYQVTTNCVFSPLDFAKIYNDESLTPELGFIGFDDAGVNYGARDFAKTANKSINKVFQTMRYRKLLVIITTPDLAMIDSQYRKLIHYWFETEKLDKKTGLCTIKPHQLEWKQKTGEMWDPFPIVDGNKIDQMVVPRLNAKDSADYEKISKEFKDRVGKEVQDSLNADNDDAPKKEFVVDLNDNRLKFFFKMKDEHANIAVIRQKLGLNNDEVKAFNRLYVEKFMASGVSS